MWLNKIQYGSREGNAFREAEALFLREGRIVQMLIMRKLQLSIQYPLFPCLWQANIDLIRNHLKLS